MSVPIPKKLRIGYADYAIASNKATDADLIENGLAGVSNGNLQKIAVRSDLPLTAQAETLLHEVIHQALYQAGLDLDAKEEEAFVRPLSMLLYGTIRSNPKLVTYLTQE